MNFQEIEIKMLHKALTTGGHTDTTLEARHFENAQLGNIWGDIQNEYEPNILAMTDKHDEQLLCDILSNGASYDIKAATAASMIITAHDKRLFLRELEQVQQLVEAGMPPMDAMKRLGDVEAGDTANEPVALVEIMREVYTEIEAVSSGAKELNTYIPTGLTDFDKSYFGLERSAYTVIAARPSMGKSAFAMGIALHAAKNGQKVLIVSLEMSKKSLVYRIYSTESGINLQSLRSGQIKTTDAWRKMANASASMKDCHIFLDDTPALNLAQLQSKVRKHSKKHGLDLLLIDYLGLMTTSNKSQKKHEYISEISNAMPSLAKELDIAVVALSQLGREVEKRPDKRPLMSDLRDSGSVEQDADAIIMLFREEYYNKTPQNDGIAEIIMLKQRNGSTGVIKAYFEKESATFKDLAKEEF